MSNYELFRKKMQNICGCEANIESDFITNSTASTLVYVPRLFRGKRAALIINDKEGPDNTIIFSYKHKFIPHELLKGDYFIWQDNYFFVFEDIKIVRSTNYKKQKAYECNVEFKIDDEIYHGYFVASLNKYIDTTLQSNINLSNNDKPVLIMPMEPWIEIDKQIIINGRPWKIIEFDDTTNKYIAYISLDRDFISKDDDVEEKPPVLEKTLKAGQEIVFPITNGIFKANIPINIVSKSINEIIFIIPYGNDSIEIQTEESTELYKVVY